VNDLLLSKIENQQFIDKYEVNLELLTRRLLGYFEKKKEKLNLTIDIRSRDNLVIEANMILGRSLGRRSFEECIYTQLL
jgi:hypothetical protein